jgi:hypothetical protein
MANSPTGRRGVALDIRASFSERPANLPAVVAYAFSRGGALLDMQPLDAKGNTKLSIPAGKESLDVRVILGPEVEKDRVNAAEVLRRGGIDRHVVVRDADIGPVTFDVRPDIFSAWIGRLCVVKGTLLKPVVSGGIPMRWPVCDAEVDIYEVDPWPILIPRLPDYEFDRLRDIIDGPWPPIRWPVPPPPPPEFDIQGLLPDPIGPRGLNPQPLPPRHLNPGLIRGVNPIPEPPRPQLQATAARSLNASVAMPPALLTSARASRAVLERAVLDNVDLLRPIFCWLYPMLVRKTKIATVTTDDCGHFSTVIWRSIFNLDQPDLYFVARQRIWNFWVTIYEPLPVACNTYWNYVCGTEVTLVTRHPLARVCPPCPPIVAPNNWVLFMAIGNSSVWRIHGANDTTTVGSGGHQPSQHGLLDNTAPWGGTLRPRLEFDNSLRDSLNVKYYRVSFKRPPESDSQWRPSTEAVNRHYSHEVDGDLVLENYALGPVSVGTSSHLYEIPPSVPPGGGKWVLPNAVLDSQSAVFDTVATAPGTAFDASGNPVGAENGGLWQIKVELFDAAGALVDPEGLGIKWRVPESIDLTGTIPTADAATLGLVDAVANCMIVTVRVDNNLCAARIDAPELDGSAAADQCGVLNYSARASVVEVPFFALQRNAFADYSFYVQRGAIWPPELAVSGVAATSAGTMPAAPTETVDHLLDSCKTAGFVEHLYVAHRATDGWSRQSQYDAHATRAFVLAPVTP